MDTQQYNSQPNTIRVGVKLDIENSYRTYEKSVVVTLSSDRVLYIERDVFSLLDDGFLSRYTDIQLKDSNNNYVAITANTSQVVKKGIISFVFEGKMVDRHQCRRSSSSSSSSSSYSPENFFEDFGIKNSQTNMMIKSNDHSNIFEIDFDSINKEQDINTGSNEAANSESSPPKWLPFPPINYSGRLKIEAKRVKEREIGQVLDILERESKAYRELNKRQKSAQSIGMSDNTLKSYRKIVGLGIRYHFDFDANLTKGVGVLNAFIK